MALPMASIDAFLQIPFDWVILFFSFFAGRPMRNTRNALAVMEGFSPNASGSRPSMKSCSRSSAALSSNLGTLDASGGSADRTRSSHSVTSRSLWIAPAALKHGSRNGQQGSPWLLLFRLGAGQRHAADCSSLTSTRALGKAADSEARVPFVRRRTQGSSYEDHKSCDRGGH